jgi:xanthine permease XanP
MKKPLNVAYGVAEHPPLPVAVLSGFQHVGLMSMYLVYPVLIARAADATPEVAASMVSLTLLAVAIGTLLQVITIGPLGSGLLCPPIPTVVYLVPSLMAAQYGGLPLVFAMTVLAGILEIALSRTLRMLRPMFPPEIAGLVVLLVGIATGAVGLRITFGATDHQFTADVMDFTVALLTLAMMVGLNVWGRGAPRLFCVLIGMAFGYAVTWSLGRFQTSDIAAVSSAALLAVPNFGHVSWTFDSAVGIPFAVAAMAATLKVIGNVTTCQKANDAEWVRADMRTISRGVLADGVGTVVAGTLGTPGLNTSSASVGLATATGVLSRSIGYPIAAILIVLAFLPKLGLLFYVMPRPVAGAALIFSATFIVVNGLEIMTSRLLDARKTLVIGLALIAGLAVDLYPAMTAGLPYGLRVVLGTSLVFGTLVALALNGLFRIGVRQKESLIIPPGPIEPGAIEDFMERKGAEWGARRDVIERARFNLVQSVETILDGCDPQGPLRIMAAFDEFSLDLRVSYRGSPLELPDRRPSNEEIIGSEDGQRALAGFMLRRLADRVNATHQGGVSTVLFHFDH